MPRALLSVSDKTGVTELSRALVVRGFDLVSTGGTARALEQAGLAVVPVSAVTGFPEMMDGRVKTLHPKVHGGILARRGHADDLTAASAHGITLIDLVVVNLYPFVKTAARTDVTFEDLIDEIDIGGPSLVRAAAKNFESVMVVVSPDDYQAVIEQLDRPDGPDRGFRLNLARKAFAHTARYDSAIASTLATVTLSADGFTRTGGGPLPADLAIHLGKVRDLRYGENPHQRAALYEGFGSRPGFTMLQGKELSYTNLLDLDSAARIVMEFDEPAAAVIKHTNPCGVATGGDQVDAYVRARDADSLAAFGGIVGLNRPLDPASARAIVSTFIEAVIAPSVDDESRAILATKPNMRVVVGGAPSAEGAGGADELEMRSVLGGVLIQSRDMVREAHVEWPGAEGLRVVTRRAPSPAEWQALRFAWRVCAHVKSNTVLFASADRTLALGAGQMSRVDAVRVARMKAESLGAGALAGSAAASDAFFPFRDGLDAVAQAGATAVVQPGGSVRDQEVITAADEHNLAMVFTGRRHFRH